MPRRRGLFAFSMLVLLFMLGACAPARASGFVDDGRLRVVTTTGMLADAVRQVGGDAVQVVALMGPGVDPHLYKASEGDVHRLLSADVIFYNGLHLEARMTDIFEQMGKYTPTVAAGEAVPRELLLASPDYPDLPDPHIWMDVALWRYVVERIRDTLIEVDPAQAATYRAHADAYLQRLDALDAYIRARAQEVPPEQRVLITAHDAFQYFGHAYGFEVFAPQGISTASEAGIADIRRTIDLIVERRIRAIFVESSVPPDVIEAIVSGAKARGHDVRIGGELFSDSLGEPGTPAGTYEGMMRHNVDTIVDGLLGNTTRGATYAERTTP